MKRPWVADGAVKGKYEAADWVHMDVHPNLE